VRKGGHDNHDEAVYVLLLYDYSLFPASDCHGNMRSGIQIAVFALVTALVKAPTTRAWRRGGITSRIWYSSRSAVLHLEQYVRKNYLCFAFGLMIQK
jgi:hypothetical protein